MIPIHPHTLASSQMPAILASATPWLAVNILEALRGNDFMGWLCLISCGLMSVISWAIIAYKYINIRATIRHTNIFLNKCASGGNLHEAFKVASNYKFSPLANILREAYMELKTEGWFEKKNLPLDARMEAVKVTVDRVMEFTASSEIRRLESGLGFLATTANVGPLIGLFGTVWGILGAFQAVAREGSAAVASLAPGVSTALLTTVVGLIAAIPAVLAYNHFIKHVQNLIRRMDSFSMEIANIILKELLKGVR